MHGTSKAGINAPGFTTVAALNGKRDVFVFLHANAWDRSTRLSLKRLDYVLGLGVFYLAVNLTQTTTNAGFFLNIYPFHS